jgi:hypothetical protein
MEKTKLGELEEQVDRAASTAWRKSRRCRS